MSLLNENNNQFITFTYNVLDDFSIYGDELLSMHYCLEFNNYLDMYGSGVEYYQGVKDRALEERKGMEANYYNGLRSQLLAKLQEMKFYSHVNILDTRRLCISSHNCIANIHLLIRDNMHLNVYFRSSDYINCLPADLEFISRLPSDFIAHLEEMKEKKGYEEVTPSVIDSIKRKDIRLNLFFGSLHRI